MMSIFAVFTVARLHTCRGFTILAIKPTSYPDLAKRRLAWQRRLRLVQNGNGYDTIQQHSSTGITPLGDLGLSPPQREHNRGRRDSIRTNPHSSAHAATTSAAVLGRADTVGAEAGAIQAQERRGAAIAAVRASPTLPMSKGHLHAPFSPMIFFRQNPLTSTCPVRRLEQEKMGRWTHTK
ncbi:hypothetical protein EDB85DRAFT_1992109 [Lactarius pseudohatsudake]|nr:hypothetical protein EDB85DRAFT_1992109 [Lactarius pseudohatsudake]